MAFLEKRGVFTLIFLLYVFCLAGGVALLNHVYDEVRLTSGAHAALGMAVVGLGIMVMVQFLMALAFVVRLRAADRTAWWALPAVVPFLGIPFFLIGLLGDGEHSWHAELSNRSITATSHKPLFGVGAVFVIAAAGLFFWTDLHLALEDINRTGHIGHNNGVFIPTGGSIQSSGNGIPIPAPRISCYDPERVNTIGQSGWIGGCGGSLIVNDALLRQAASVAVGGNEAFGITGPDGRFYSFANSTRTIFTGQATNFSRLFYNTTFNDDIEHWDTSNVVDMSFMFAYTAAFNQSIGAWDTSNVRDMEGMFEAAESFNDGFEATDLFTGSFQYTNQSIENWNTTNVRSMHRMFANAISFNQPLGKWDVAAVLDMSQMFFSAYSFEQDLSTWNTSNVRTMEGMFESAEAFNGSIERWNLARATNLSRMFYNAYNFNQDISSWNTSRVTDMSYMFWFAQSFDQPIGSWNTSNVNDVQGMFAYAANFNQPLDGWNMSKVITTHRMFAHALAFNQPIERWDTSSVTDMSQMFWNADAFSQPIGRWNTSSVDNMSQMFFEANSFNQSVGSWNIDNVTSMDSMFENAASFDQDLSGWATSMFESPIRFSTGTPPSFQNNNDRKPALFGPTGPGTGERFGS